MGDSHAIAAGAAISAFSEGPQHNRLMRLDFPHDDGPQVAILLVNTLRAREEVSRGFRFEVEVLSDDARIPLKMLMARMVTISLVRQDGSLRYFNGYVTEFRFLRTDGGFAFYHMLLEPWLALARLRKNCMSFHGKTVRDITEETFRNYPQADWRMYPADGDKPLTVANQYNETDFNHLHRRWEALGLHYWYEHRFDGHRLMLSDRSVLAEEIDATRPDDPETVPFQDEGGAAEDDGIREWTAVRRLGSGQTTLASFDYKNPVAQRAAAPSANQQGDVFAYEVYEDTGAYGFRLSSDGEQRARQHMVERDKDTQYFEGAGTSRTMQAGRAFALGDHFSAEPRSVEYDPEPRRGIGDRRYLILAVVHEASNNYQAGPGAPSKYENRFTCIRRDIDWRPGLSFNSEPCADPGLQTAIVVGPAGSEIHTDGYGRVKVQFHWDRVGTYDENSSAWVRVMTPAAGAEFGQIRLPRVGEEVVVFYPDGNIDHPLILGAVFNAKHSPPWSLPNQSALSGLRSRELGGGTRGNHFVLDDTHGQIQTQLKSDHLCSQLSLGHIARIEDTSGRKDERGEGWELRTDGHGVARAAHGMLITTEARPAAHGAITDMDETVQRLDRACSDHTALAQAAQKNSAQEAFNSQDDVAAILRTQNEAVQGGSDGPGATSALTKPHLVLASAAGIATATAGDTHLASDRHTAVTTGKHLSLAAGASLFASVRHAVRLFVQKAGMKMVAAAGDIDLKALSDSVNLLAKLNITQTANRITINASQEVQICGGGSYLRLNESSIELGTSGSLTVHAADNSFVSANSLSLPISFPAAHLGDLTHLMNESPATGTDSWVSFELVSHDGPIAHEAYKLTDSTGKIHEGQVDDKGVARIEHVASGKCQVEFPNLGYSIETTSS